MSITKKRIAIIAPDSLLRAFRILFQAESNIDLLAAEVSVKTIKSQISKRPDIVLTYLTKERHSPRGKGVRSTVIEELKSIWPDVYIIAIVSNIQQRAEVQTMGADQILFEGAHPSQILVVIENVETVNEFSDGNQGM